MHMRPPSYVFPSLLDVATRARTHVRTPSLRISVFTRTCMHTPRAVQGVGIASVCTFTKENWCDFSKVAKVSWSAIKVGAAQRAVCWQPARIVMCVEGGVVGKGVPRRRALGCHMRAHAGARDASLASPPPPLHRLRSPPPVAVPWAGLFHLYIQLLHRHADRPAHRTLRRCGFSSLRCAALLTCSCRAVCTVLSRFRFADVCVGDLCPRVARYPPPLLPAHCFAL